MKRWSSENVYSLATATLVFIVPAVQMLEERLTEQPITHQPPKVVLIYLLLSGLGYFFYFRAVVHLLNRWRLRDWLGDWFYTSRPDPAAKIRDGGYAWMRFYLLDGEVHYTVTRYREYEQLVSAYARRRTVTNGLATFARAVRRLFVKVQPTFADPAHRDVSAYSEIIRFDHEHDALVVFYHARYADPALPERRGRLELELEGPEMLNLARGRFSSVLARGETLVPSHGSMLAYRRLREMQGRRSAEAV